MTREIVYGPEIPGGLAFYKARELKDGGLIEFELAPAGYLTRKGTPRLADWRAYHFTPPGGKRERRVSVTTLLDSIANKAGLPPWSEEQGIRGCQRAHRQDLLDADATEEKAVQVVRSEHLGADAARDEAADRGLNVHALLQDYMETGKAPNPSQHPEPHRGFIRALVAWLLHADPQPVLVEELVCSPADGYAGRLDLMATIGGPLTAVDAKTQARAGIYLQAHVQLALYIRAHIFCDGEPPDRGRVVVFAQDGEWREMELAVTEEAALAALAWYRHARPVESLCESSNRVERNARKELAAA